MVLNNRKLSISSDKNESLKNILNLLRGASQIKSIDSINSLLHNTKLVILVANKLPIDDQGVIKTKQRIILYNRLNIELLIPDYLRVTSILIDDLIFKLNTLHGCDFTTSDLEIVNGTLQAKPKSLGYYGLVYLNDDTITEPEEPEEPVDPTEPVVVDKFDYAVLRYIWTDAGGTDLDTRTLITTPARNTMVGWDKESSDDRNLMWGGDNTGDGVESVLINMKKLIQEYPDLNEFRIDCRAFWYNTVATGNLKIQFESYLGGYMEPDGYDFQNIQGQSVQKIMVDVNTLSDKSFNNMNGELLAYLSYVTRPQQVGKLTPITKEVHRVTNLIARIDDMAKIKLTWTNTLGVSMTQRIQKKKDTDTDWVDVSLTMTEVVETPNGWEAEDTDIVYTEDTNILYRVVTTSGQIQIVGNEITVTVPATPTAVSDLNYEFINDM